VGLAVFASSSTDSKDRMYVRCDNGTDVALESPLSFVEEGFVEGPPSTVSWHVLLESRETLDKRTTIVNITSCMFVGREWAKMRCGT
jgi:hypothetical protein